MLTYLDVDSKDISLAWNKQCCANCVLAHFYKRNHNLFNNGTGDVSPNDMLG